jgi:hypothetical protein
MIDDRDEQLFLSIMGHRALRQLLTEVFHPDGTHIIGPAKYATYMLIVVFLLLDMMGGLFIYFPFNSTDLTWTCVRSDI